MSRFKVMTTEEVRAMSYDKVVITLNDGTLIRGKFSNETISHIYLDDGTEIPHTSIKSFKAEINRKG